MVRHVRLRVVGLVYGDGNGLKYQGVPVPLYSYTFQRVGVRRNYLTEPEAVAAPGR